MLKRRIEIQLRADFEAQAAVALLGPRQVGKTTLALALGAAGPSLYLDLQDPADRDKLADPVLYLQAHEDKLVILDEIQNVPDLFQTLRGLIDRGRRKGRRTGRFLILGSASVELLRQSSESLAGRIAYRELSPLDITEAGPTKALLLWLRGGFPQSFLARGEAKSLAWRRDFLRTYLTRDIPAFEPRIPAETSARAMGVALMGMTHRGSGVSGFDLQAAAGRVAGWALKQQRPACHSDGRPRHPFPGPRWRR